MAHSDQNVKPKAQSRVPLSQLPLFDGDVGRSRLPTQLLAELASYHTDLSVSSRQRFDVPFLNQVRS